MVLGSAIGIAGVLEEHKAIVESIADGNRKAAERRCDATSRTWQRR
jgi:DNA-binding FadR family transcriptional regulator